MSLSFKDDLQEYARQCVAQRQRYEACLREGRDDCLAEALDLHTEVTVQAAASADLADQNELDTGEAHLSQSCVVELMDTTPDPLGWRSDLMNEPVTAAQPVVSTNDMKTKRSRQAIYSAP